MPAPLEPRHTLKDVADRAGVAISTASLEFSGKRPVAEPKRERVLKAASDLDYGGPNPLASSLRQGRSGIIGVFAVSILDVLAQHLGQNSAGILLMPAQGAGQDALVRRTAGIPLVAVVFPLGGHVSSALLEHLRHRRIPLVGTGYPEADDVLHLRMDERGAARAIAQHLYDLGHRDVALIQLPGAEPNAQRDVMNPEALDRTAGFLEVFPEAVVTSQRARVPSRVATRPANACSPTFTPSQLSRRSPT
ncbi:MULTISPECIES: LacI family DNA-binding transcriptional regulator [Dermacoccus]|uniref:LacI family transcriptional regulator n=2 Tax=Dermacoccus TaxID=57495 RepID=A0A417YVG9_9MICO|nr:LacI family DNA-binding transcriptional regulator [Dermacoccus abyssi]RHW41413.1 LacI family transcriptional regulator [Dermacoccus abyssi]